LHSWSRRHCRQHTDWKIGEDHSEENEEEQVTPSSPIGKNLKREGESLKKSPFRKGKNPMVRVMSHMVDDVISANSVTSKALTSLVNP
jgi:hypothetical protein